MLSNYLLRLKAKLDRQNSIGHTVKIENDCFIERSSIHGAITIGTKSKIFGAEIRGKISIGRFCSVWGPNTDILSRINEIKIGGFTSIARNVTIQEYNHYLDRASTYFVFSNIFKEEVKEDIWSKAPILIGHDVWIGAHSVILSGARIGNGAVVAANSVVNADVPPYAIVAGSPAKVIKYRFDQEIIQKLTEIEWWNWSLDKIKNNKNFFKSKITLDILNETFF